MFTFGRFIDGKLNERDKKTGKPKHKIEKLLGIEVEPPVVAADVAMRMLQTAFGVTAISG